MDCASAALAEPAATRHFAGTLEPEAPELHGLAPGAATPTVHAAADEPLQSPALPQARRLNVKPDDLKNGLGQLVLTLVKLLHELLERQALRRIDSGSLSEAQVERLGTTLMQQAEQIDRLRHAFNLEEEDLNIDLGPLGRLF